MHKILNFCAITIEETNFKNQHPESKKKKTKQENHANTAYQSLPNLEI